MKFSEFFEEDNGRFSSMRLVFIIGTAWSMFMTTYLVIGSEADPTTALAFFSAVEGVFAGFKLGQKPMEIKEDTVKTEKENGKSIS